MPLRENTLLFHCEIHNKSARPPQLFSASYTKQVFALSNQEFLQI